MSDRDTRFGVVVKDLFWNEQHYEKHRPSYYVASVINNCLGGEMTANGRVYYFGRTIGEISFWEADNQLDAEAIADKFNRLWKKGVYQSPARLARGLQSIY